MIIWYTMRGEYNQMRQSQQPSQFPLYITYDEHITGGEPESDEQWCSYSDTNITFRITGLHHRKGLNEAQLHWTRQKVELDFDPSLYKYLYVVVVRYSTGDSFGSTYGAWHIEGVYRTPEEAYTIKKQIEEKTYDKQGSYPPWVGYFECLEDVEITLMDVRA